MDLTLYRRLSSPDYLTGLAARSIDELRTMRSSCQELEDEVSLARRVVQGRLDIIRHEIDRRRSGAEPSATGDLLVSLPEVLTAGRTGSSVGEVDEFADIDRVTTDDSIVAVSGLGSAAVEGVHDELEFAERVLSLRRRRLFDAIDTLADEITRRYRSGEASVDSILR